MQIGGRESQIEPHLAAISCGIKEPVILISCFQGSQCITVPFFSLQFGQWSFPTQMMMLKPKMWFYLAPWGNHMACDSTDAHYEHMVILNNSRWSWERKFLKALFFYQFSSTSQSCLIPCDPIDCSTPDFPVHHQLPELTQTHLH